MNDEIKEILNNADSSTKFKMVDEDGTEKEMNIAGFIEQLLNDNKHLLNYVTNLQEENERLKEENILLKASEPMSKIAEDYGYKSRCEKAIELYKNCKEKDYCILSSKMYEILIGSDENE